jgi:transcriptional regulator GlxA family with amidase domain
VCVTGLSAVAVPGASPAPGLRANAVTTMSPLQYQKQIRLQKARMELIAAPHDVAAIGHAVGYDSSSQFSREYRRMFGAPPGQDALRLQSAVIVRE